MILALLLACNTEKPSPEEIDTTDSVDTSSEVELDSCSISDVFERNGCLECHGDNAELNGGGINLTEDNIEESLIGVPSVSPGCAEESLVNIDNPNASIILHNLSSTSDNSTFTSDCAPIPMPLGGYTTIPSEDVDCVAEWIQSLDQNEENVEDVTYPAPAFTVLTKVKYLLDGGALTTEELSIGVDTEGELLQSGLEALVETWMNSERFLAKRRQFLELHLQQTPSDTNYFNQFRNTRPNSMRYMRDAFSASFVRTAERIVDNDEDFSTIVTTNTWEVTTLLLLALKMADNPMFLKANGVWPKNNALNDIKYVTASEMGLYDRQQDSEDWRTVTLLHNPTLTDMTAEEDFLDSDNANALRNVPDGGSIELRTPRIGFFTTPAFYQTWQTNRDNDFRVTINQAMIVATGMTFSPSDNTPLTGDDSAVDPDLFPRDSTCYGCHKNLDTMRPAFQANFDNINTRHTVLDAELPAPGFSFKGQSVYVNSLVEWADALATHPSFSMAWVLKLCQWSTSTECSPTNEHVLTLAESFGQGHNLSQLFYEFFTSPLMTLTSDNLNTTAPGAQVSVARFGHYCHAMRSRMTDIRGVQGYSITSLPDRLDICRENGPAEILSASLPKDQVVRGSIGLHQPRDYTPMVSISFEGMCAATASEVVDTNNKAAFNPNDPDLVLELMNIHLLGFPVGTVQYQRAADMFERYFNALTMTPVCADPEEFRTALSTWEPDCGLGLSDTDALRDLWILACNSPSMTGVGQ